MKVLLDNNMPKMLRKVLKGHIVLHAYDLGWADVPDTILLPLAENHGFDVILTNDKKMHSQQNNAKRKISLVVAETNSRKMLRAAHDKVRATVERSTPGSYSDLELTSEQA